MFAALAATGMHRRIVVGVAAYPGASMDVLWRGTDAREVIRRLPWDYVVLQPRLSSADSATFAGDTRLFYQEIAARRARPVVWEQYWSDALTRADQARLDAGIGAAARGMHATVAHVPEAWEAVRQADAGLWHRLFESDGHPTPIGSYLTALAVYRAIAGQSPVGLPRAAGATLFSQRDVDLLQRAAASTP
jgi:hypothetical protein